MADSSISDEDKVQIAHELRHTIRELRDRGLLVAAKWASELLASLPIQYRQNQHIPFSPPPQPHFSQPPLSPPHGPRPSIGDFLPSPPAGNSLLPIAGPSRLNRDIEEEDDIIDEDEFQLAKGYFDVKEFDRVVHVLKDAPGKRARFLRIYSAYLSADRRAQEALPHFLDTKNERILLFPALSPLLSELEETPPHQMDAYLLYLQGLLYMRLEQRPRAIECFTQSIKQKVWNWSCWSQMAQLVNTADMFIEIKNELPTTPMMTFFAITVMLDLHTATDLVMAMIKELLQVFPSSCHLKAQRALVYYHMRDFEAAEREFDAVQAADPYRMEDVDIYSNMLYVMDKKAKLGKLAHEYAELDRNRAEVCCLIGNYYSSRADHTKAIIYFKRSLMLNRDYLPAWTLMGHEYVELKNSHAAIEAYRKAVDVNAKDYRAWYGLGQAYELLDMPMYAIEYYNQATALRPYDCRMWSALAAVYEGLQRLPEAIQSHTRALLGADKLQTPSILLKLAGLHSTLDETNKAITYHEKILALGEKNGMTVSEMAGSYIAVSEWELGKDTGGDWALAGRYLEKVGGTNVPQRSRAEELLRELRLKEGRAAAGL